ncbi:response regulator [bacterium]|nr:response regulator [bacterium]
MEQNFNQSSTLSVLVATQDEAVKRQVLNVLEKKEYPVVVAHDCEQVLEYLLDRDFDVVIFDPSIKELEGSDAIKLIKRLRPQLPLVVLADESSYETSIKIAQAGVYFRLFKPLDTEITKELIASLEGKVRSQS